MTMIVTQGRVIAVREGVAEVQLTAKSACGSCGAKAVCGSGSAHTVNLPAPEGVGPGDTLDLAVPEARLNAGAVVGYLLPATTTLLGAVLLSSGGDDIASIGAFIGLVGGLFLTRRFGAGLLLPSLSTCSPHTIQGETP